MFWLKMAFRSNCGEKKLEFSHQKSALPMIFFKILQKARISRIFQIRAFRKTERAEPSFLTKSSSQNRAEPRLGSITTNYRPDYGAFKWGTTYFNLPSGFLVMDKNVWVKSAYGVLPVHQCNVNLFTKGVSKLLVFRVFAIFDLKKFLWMIQVSW